MTELAQNLPESFLLKPEENADRINAIINDPSIYPLVRGNQDGPLDLSEIVSNKDNVVLVGEFGGIVFIKIQPGIYECHTNVLPAGRGQWVKENASKVLNWMFLNTDAVEIFTRCPLSNPAAIFGARAAGFTKYFTTGKIWPQDGEMVPMDVYGLLIENWVNSAPDLVEQGVAFHDLLEDEYKRLGKEIAIHEDDETHNRYVGAASFMINSGHPWKAINFYNRWAKMSNYQAISIVSTNPLVIDIGDAELKIVGNSFEVL